jgi:hypothetical protein
VLRDVLWRGLEQLGHPGLGQPQRVGHETAFDAAAAVFGFVEEELASLRQ